MFYREWQQLGLGATRGMLNMPLLCELLIVPESRARPGIIDYHDAPR
jgi:hypothetical protein